MLRVFVPLLAVALALLLSACGDPSPTQTGQDSGPSPEPDAAMEVDEGSPAPDAGAAEPDLPPPPDPGPTGAACLADTDCLGGRCIVGDRWPGGYCTVDQCASDCGEQSGCLESEEWGTFCALQCDGESDCRAGFACTRTGRNSPSYCLPVRGLPDGEPCEGRGDCQNFCNTEWPGGHCSSFRCETVDDCSSQGMDNACLVSNGFGYCVRRCQGPTDCREGYLCETIGTESVCLPDPSRPFDPAVFDPSPLGITCGITPQNGVATFQYDVPEGTTSYMVTPLTRDGQPLLPDRITMPSGNSVAFVLANAFMAVGSQIYASMNPTIVPSTPSRAGQLESGTHTYSLETESSEVCWYYVGESAVGTTIDLNVYLVGVPNVTAATAESDPNLSAVLAQFETIYAAANISIGKVRYFELNEEDTTRFSVVRSELEIEELVKRSKPPADDLDSLMSVNIFFAGAFAMRGTVGISLGLPGPVGLHGTHGSGVVFTTEYMGQQVEDGFGMSVDGNVYTGQILAHEVGHYLGLFHTTESTGGAYDPLPDTPECGQISLSCPDIDNLMFPFAGESHSIITPDQSFVIGVNPLTKPAAIDGGP